MAVSVSIPNPVWSARLLANFQDQAVLYPLSTNEFEGDVAEFGSSVRISSFTDNITISDYTQNSNMNAAETLTTTTQDLAIDQRKYFHFQLDEVDRVQLRPEVIDRATETATRNLVLAVDAKVVADLNAATPTSITNTITAAQVNSGFTKAHLGAILPAIREEAYKKNVAVSDCSWVITPRVAKSIETGIIVNELGDLFQANMVNPGQRDTMDVSNGFWGTLMGINVYVSNQAALAGSSSTVPDKTYVLTPRANGTVVQFQSFETYRPELRFADAYKGLMVYGNKVLDPTRIFKLTFAHL